MHNLNHVAVHRAKEPYDCPKQAVTFHEIRLNITVDNCIFFGVTHQTTASVIISFLKKIIHFSSVTIIHQLTIISAFLYVFLFSHLIAISTFCNLLGCLWYTALKYLGGKIPSSFPGQRITLFADKKNLNPSANIY